MSTRFTRADIETLNAALALFEADLEADEPDEFADDAAWEEWRIRYDHVQSVRMKVHARRRALVPQ